MHALYVIDTGTIPLAVLKADVRETLREMGEQASTEAFGRIAPRAEAAGVELVTDVVEGTPEERIVDYAAEHEVDLIVMGTHSRSGLERRLLGSVTEQVFRSAPAPVLTVGQDAPDG
ncbi:MAG: universal stress protein [Halolamina sp.]